MSEINLEEIKEAFIKKIDMWGEAAAKQNRIITIKTTGKRYEIIRMGRATVGAHKGEEIYWVNGKDDDFYSHGSIVGTRALGRTIYELSYGPCPFKTE